MRTNGSGQSIQNDRHWVKPGRVFELVLALGLVMPVALAQKPPGGGGGPVPSPRPGPTPNPVGLPTGGPVNNPNPIAPNMRSADERVMFLRGIVVIADGSTVPYDLLVERVCNERVVQQVYAGPRGDFSMQLGSRTQVAIDASADVEIPNTSTPDGLNQGVPRQQLLTCELRTTAPGFRMSIVRLMDLTVTAGNVDVGRITVDRVTKVDGATVNAAAYRAPKDAIKAYEKGMSAARDGKSADAEKYFEKAVQIYPKYSNAWYELGVVRQTVNDRDGAKAAFAEAAQTSKKFLAPYLKLAEMAFVAKDWAEVLRLTEHIIEVDPLNHTDVSGYVLDLDPMNAGEAYFYNAMANYRLGKIDEAEKSALKAEHVDLMTKFPELHLLLAQIWSEKGNYAGAIGELETYMELVPGAKDEEPLRTTLAKLQELNGTAGAKRE